MAAEQPYKMTTEVREAMVRYVRRRGWNVGKVASVGGVGVRTVERYLAEDEDFRAAIDEAKGVFLAKLERAAERRAIKGVTSTRKGKDGDVYTETKYSDTLLVHLLKANGRGKHTEHIEVDQRTKADVAVDLSAIAADPEARALLRKLLQRSVEGEPEGE